MLDDEGLVLAGTNQRFGLRGDVRIKPGGRIRLRRSEFEISQGFVRFDDLTRIAPQVDVTAVTEYRRYSEASDAERQLRPSTGDGRRGSSAARPAAAGASRCTPTATPTSCKIDLTSEPALAQDDIFLLLTVGLTRAELDQAQSASVGESVALEALGTLTGADRAVKERRPGDRRVPLRQRLLVAHRPHRADGHDRQAPGRAHPRQRDERPRRIARNPLERRVAAERRASASKARTTT